MVRRGGCCRGRITHSWLTELATSRDVVAKSKVPAVQLVAKFCSRYMPTAMVMKVANVEP